MEIESLIVLSKHVTKIWARICYVLAVLLGLSVGGNIYQAKQITNLRLMQTNGLNQRIAVRVPTSSCIRNKDDEKERVD